MQITRRGLLLSAGCLLTTAVVAAWAGDYFGATLPSLEVAYAGSMSSIMEGPIKVAAARNLGLDLHGRAQGSNGLAQLITSGSIRPDLFICITPGPMYTVLRAGKCESAQPIAGTEMVIAYSPKSRFAPALEGAANGQGRWADILQTPGFRFGRTDPATDPQGRNIIFTMMLAAKHYGRPELVQNILGPVVNERQIFTEPTLQARLQSGEVDAVAAYKFQPGPFFLPYIALPKEVNLSDPRTAERYPDVTLDLDGVAYRPEPLAFYAAVLRGARNSEAAGRFAQWLLSEAAQALFRRNDYGPAPSTSVLRV